MPIALLLQETVYTMRWGAHRLEPWIHLVRVEEILIARARGAFLSHWFGRDLPLKGSRLRIVIENLDALRDRWIAAGRSVALAPEGPNVTEPLAGLTGQLAGILLSPTGFVLGVSVILRNVKYWANTLHDALGWKVFLLPLWPGAGAILGAFAPIGLLAGVGLSLNQSAEGRRARNLVNFLGALAPLIQSATKFLDLLMGPRESIKNPVLRGLMEFLDQLAGLIPFALAAVAVILVELGPLIVPLARQLKAFMNLSSEVKATLSDIFGDVHGGMTDEKNGATGQIKTLPDVFARIIPIVLDKLDFVLVQLSLVFPVLEMMLTGLWDSLIESFTPLIDKATKAVTDWKIETTEKFKQTLKSHPVSATIAIARDIFSLAVKSWPGKAPPDWTDKALTGALSATETAIEYSPPGLAVRGAIDIGKGAYTIYDKYLRGPSRSAGDIFAFPELPSFASIVARRGGPPPKGLDAIDIIARIDMKYGGALSQGYAPVAKGVEEGAAEARKPTQVFAGEQAKLRRELGNVSPEQALAALRGEQLGLPDQVGLRGLLKVVVGRILPGEMRAYMEPLLQKFREIDKALYLQKVEEAKSFPVRDLPDNGLLRPVVKTLTIRGVDLSRADAETFQQLLRDAMNALSYPAVKPADSLAPSRA